MESACYFLKMLCDAFGGYLRLATALGKCLLLSKWSAIGLATAVLDLVTTFLIRKGEAALLSLDKLRPLRSLEPVQNQLLDPECR